MEKSILTFEIEGELRQKIELLAEQAGVTLEEWCEFAIRQQLMMQESMEDIMLQVGQLGFEFEELDFDTITNQFFSQIIDLGAESTETKAPPKLILPPFPTKLPNE